MPNPFRAYSAIIVVAFRLEYYSIIAADPHYVCPDSYDYTMAKDNDEYWCVNVRRSIDDAGANFTEAVELCDSHGESLPIITNLNMDLLVGGTEQNYWIGIVCNYETDNWMWLDGEPMTYKNFYVDPTKQNCSESIANYVYHEAQWLPVYSGMRIYWSMCMRRAELSVPEPTDLCDPGWILVDGICYLIEDVQKNSWQDANEYCESFDATLPIILSEEQNERLYVETTQYILNVFVPLPFFIGLVCENDEFTWQGGSPYNYNRFQHSGLTCGQMNEGTHVYYQYYAYWGPADDSVTPFVSVCSKNSSFRTMAMYTTTELSTTTLHVETTSFDPYFDGPESTSESFSTVSDTSSSVPPTTEQTPSTISPTTTQKEIESSGLPTWEIALIVIGSLVIFCIVTVCIIRRHILSLRAKIVEVKLYGPKPDQSSNSHRYYDLPRNDWEIERKFVSIDYMKMLGEGAFGCVYLGRVLAKNIPNGMERSIIELAALKNNNDFVAVKLLHETAGAQTERDFRSEIEIMKKIGYHEKLVNILACVTQSEPILLISEHCANGDLLRFMRERRKYMLENNHDQNDEKIITVKKQILFAIQIAYGLEYLSSRGFVHRDIAARNIMVDHQESCKIGDFGLCRMIGKEEKNYQSQGGKLPLKWMAPEAIDKYLFSTASDVWSYGVLLFEILTLGGSPYADWPATELLTRLKRGDRMERPECCTDQLYEVMSHCWAELPSERATFPKLRKRLAVLLEDVNQDDYYLKLNAHANYSQY